MKLFSIFFSLALVLMLQHAAWPVTLRDEVYATKNAGRAVFSHADHISKKGMAKNCRACHDAIFNLKKKTHYSMADMKNGRSCGACHDGKKSFSVAECASCHRTREIVYKVKATGPVGFSHKRHLAQTVDCGVCHPSVFAAGPNKRFTMADMEKGKACGACHNARQAFSVKECSKCHPTRELTFKEATTGDIVFSHRFHGTLYSCADCHTSLYKTARSRAKVSMQAMEGGKSCGACHDGKTAFSVKDKCESCHKM